MFSDSLVDLHCGAYSLQSQLGMPPSIKAEIVGQQPTMKKTFPYVRLTGGIHCDRLIIKYGPHNTTGTSAGSTGLAAPNRWKYRRVIYITPNPIRQQMPIFLFNLIRTFHIINMGKLAKAKSETTEMTMEMWFSVHTCLKSMRKRSYLLERV